MAQDTKWTIRVEIVKSLLQLCVVIIIGGAVMALFELAKDRRESERREDRERREEERREDQERREEERKQLEKSQEETHLRAALRADYIKRLGAPYRSVKKARRSLCVAGLTTRYSKQPSSITDAHASSYKEGMQRINKAQLELEGLKIESEALPAFVLLVGLHDELEKMEDYLRQILKEYEETQQLLNAGKKVQFLELERLDEFTGKPRRKFNYSRYTKKTDYRFISHFAKPYDSAIEMISKKLI